jgi:hypothetical protein
MPADVISLPLAHIEQPPRRCSVDGCSVWLSSYNPTNECVGHGGWSEPATFDEQRDAFAELMEQAA